MAEKKQDDTEKLGFEQAIGELTDIVSKIEGGQTTLQGSLDQYERGMALISRCREILQSAEKRIEKIGETPATKKDDPREEDEEETDDNELF